MDRRYAAECSELSASVGYFSTGLRLSAHAAQAPGGSLYRAPENGLQLGGGGARMSLMELVYPLPRVDRYKRPKAVENPQESDGMHFITDVSTSLSGLVAGLATNTTFACPIKVSELCLISFELMRL